jgi:hypothetical protein
VHSALGFEDSLLAGIGNGNTNDSDDNNINRELDEKEFDE